MSDRDTKADLHRYLRLVREAMLWKLDGLSDYDVRRPLTPTGTNLLGLVKHLASVEIGYFGDTFGRPFFTQPPAWYLHQAGPNADMWATAEESRADVEGLYRSAWAHADATIEDLALDGEGHVPWWPAERNPVTLQLILVHVIAETNRHAGHADIVRELIDGGAGLRAENTNLPPGEMDWPAYRAQLTETAERFR